MAMRSRTFAYPYYANFSRDYESVSFAANWSRSIRKNKFCVSIFAEIADPTINELIDNGTIALTCRVSCTNTFYRHVFEFEAKSRELDFEIPGDNLDEKTVLTLFLIAMRDFEYTNASFDAFHSQVVYSIEKGNIMGESDDKVYFLRHGNDKGGADFFTRSFSDAMKDDDPVEIKYLNDSINLVMPKSMYDYLNYAEEKNKDYSEIHGLFLAPALGQTIALMVSSDLDAETSFAAENNTKRWYSILEEKLEPFGEIKPESAWNKAQLLLQRPVNAAIKNGIAEKKGRSGVALIGGSENE